jgi:hypothetical protein
MSTSKCQAMPCRAKCRATSTCAVPCQVPCRAVPHQPEMQGTGQREGLQRFGAASQHATTLTEGQ